MADIRHIELELLSYSGDLITLIEVEIISGGTNVVLGAAATASENNADAPLAVDGIQGTEWGSDLGTSNTVSWKCPVPAGISQIDSYRVLSWSGGYPTEWRLNASLDPAGEPPWRNLDYRDAQTFTNEVFNEYIGPFVMPGTDINLFPGAVNSNSSTGGLVVDTSSPTVDVVMPASGSLAHTAIERVERDLNLVIPAVGSVSRTAPPFVTQEPQAGAILTTIYKCTLEAAGDTSDYVVLPISSFQTRQNDSDPTWLQVVVPEFLRHESAVAERLDGVLRVYQGTRDQHGNEVYNPLAWANLDQYQFQIGGLRSSAVLGGYGDEQTLSPKPWQLQDIRYRANNAGARSVRAKPDQSLRPGDTAIYDGGSFVVGQIRYAVSPTSSQMDVVEVTV